MAGKNDILASAGVDLSDFDKGIAKLTSRLDAVEKSGSRAASGIERVDKSASKLANIAIADKFVQGLELISSGGSEATRALAQLDTRAALGNLSEGAANMAKFNQVGGMFLDFASKVPGYVGVIATAGQSVVKSFVEQTIAARSANAEFQKKAFTIDAVIAKEQKYQALTKEFQKVRIANNEQDNKFIAQVSKAREVNSKIFEQQTNTELKAADNLSAGAELRLAALDVEKDRQQKIADLKAANTPEGTQGEMGDAAKRIVASETKKINLEAKGKLRIIALAQQQERSEATLNEAASKRGVLLDDQIEKQKTEKNELKKQLAIAKEDYSANSVQVTDIQKKLQQNLLVTREIEKAKGMADADKSINDALAKRDVTIGSQNKIIEAQIGAEGKKLSILKNQVQVDEYAVSAQQSALQTAKIAKENYYYLNGKDLEQQRLITAQINAQAAGNQKLAALAQVRAQFELQIADAIRQGNDNKARELARQQAAAELGARAADFRKTPQDRQAEIKEQQSRGLAERTTNARDKDIKARADAIRKSKSISDPSLFNEKEGRFKTDDELLGRTDSTNRKSKADEKARQEFADRNEKRLLDAGKDAINRVNNFQAENFIAGKIMNAP